MPRPQRIGGRRKSKTARHSPLLGKTPHVHNLGFLRTQAERIDPRLSLAVWETSDGDRDLLSYIRRASARLDELEYGTLVPAE